jgi:hypothetical protein
LWGLRTMCFVSWTSSILTLVNCASRVSKEAQFCREFRNETWTYMQIYISWYFLNFLMCPHHSENKVMRTLIQWSLNFTPLRRSPQYTGLEPAAVHGATLIGIWRHGDDGDYDLRSSWHQTWHCRRQWGRFSDVICRTIRIRPYLLNCLQIILRFCEAVGGGNGSVEFREERGSFK